MRRFGCWVALGVVVLGLEACGGKASKADDEGSQVAPPGGSGGQAPRPGGAGGSGGVGAIGGAGGSGNTTAGSGGIPGGCLALCIPTAQLAVTGFPSTQLFTSTFEACRNDECYEGSFPATGGNSITLTGEGWETKVELIYFEALELELRLQWMLPPSSQEFTDGDRYRLTATSATGEVSTLIDTAVSYEQFDHCSGPCTRAYVDGFVYSAAEAGAPSRDQ